MFPEARAASMKHRGSRPPAIEAVGFGDLRAAHRFEMGDARHRALRTRWPPKRACIGVAWKDLRPFPRAGRAGPLSPKTVSRISNARRALGSPTLQCGCDSSRCPPPRALRALAPQACVHRPCVEGPTALPPRGPRGTPIPQDCDADFEMLV